MLKQEGTRSINTSVCAVSSLEHLEAQTNNSETPAPIILFKNCLCAWEEQH